MKIIKLISTNTFINISVLFLLYQLFLPDNSLAMFGINSWDDVREIYESGSSGINWTFTNVIVLIGIVIGAIYVFFRTDGDFGQVLLYILIFVPGVGLVVLGENWWFRVLGIVLVALFIFRHKIDLSDDTAKSIGILVWGILLGVPLLLLIYGTFKEEIPWYIFVCFLILFIFLAIIALPTNNKVYIEDVDELTIEEDDEEIISEQDELTENRSAEQILDEIFGKTR